MAPKILELGIKYIAVDAFFAKIKYINGVVTLGLHAINKLRKDTRLFRIYDGPQKTRGRIKKTDKSKINSEDFKNSPIIEIKDEQIELRSCTAYSVSLKCQIKVIWMEKFIGANKHGEVFLFLTEMTMYALLIYQLYVTRFQIEFIFRYAKGIYRAHRLPKQKCSAIELPL